MPNYSGNEPLIPLTQTQADEQLANVTFGVSLNRHDIINFLLIQEGAVGIRHYPALQPNGDNTTIAVPVKSDMGEVEGPGRTYLRSNGNDIDRQSTRLLRSDTKWYLKYTINDPKHYHAYFSQFTINKILNDDTLLGIRFYDATHNGKSTMMMVGVYKDSNGHLVDKQGDGAYILSDKPCPVDCPPQSIGDLYTKPPT